MTVKNLITELLNLPMDAEVNIVYVDENWDYEYQEVLATTYYEEDDTVGLIGNR